MKGTDINKMENKHYVRIFIIVSMVITSSFIGLDGMHIFGQDAKKAIVPSKTIKQDQVKNVEKNVIQAPISPSPIVGSAWSEVLILASGGYFFPGGDQADYLNPNWSAKLIIQKNNIAETLFGGGIDISYAQLKDKEVEDGRMTFITLMPNATATFSLFNVVNAQMKAGVGLSGIYYKVNETSDFSLSLTLSGGVGMFRVFGRHFVLGVEAVFWYYFQMYASSAMGIFGYTGYYF